MERNPYSPPGAVVADPDYAEKAPTGKRPVGLWVLLIYCALGAVATGIAIALIQIQHLPPEQYSGRTEMQFFTELGLPWFSGALITGALLLVTSVQLFRRRTSAAYVISVIGAAAGVRFVLISRGVGPFGHHPTRNATSAAFTVAAVWYVWHVVRKGVLK